MLTFRTPRQRLYHVSVCRFSKSLKRKIYVTHEQRPTGDVAALVQQAVNTKTNIIL